MLARYLLMACLVISSYSAASESLRKVGTSRLTVLWFDIYDATLYSPSGNYEKTELPLKLSLNYLRDISASQLLDETDKQWRKAAISSTQRQLWLAELAKLWPDIEKGQQLSFTQYSNSHGQFHLGSRPLGSIRSQSFAQAFIDIWLGPATSYPSEAKQLKGEGQ